MIAIYLSPIYLLLNLYILRWAYLWMGTCHSILRTLGFRLIFAVIYVLLSTSLLTGFLIKNPKSLHRMLKITGNYFLGIFLYTLVIILLADFGRILLKYVFHASWIHSRTAFTVAGAICALLILLLSACGIFHAKYIKTTSYDVIINKTIPERTSMKVVLLADTHFGYNAGVLHARELVRKINKQKPDLVCIAGDIFDNDYRAVRNPDKIAEILKGIKTKYGVYGCWGNHDVTETLLGGFSVHSAENNERDTRFEDLMKKSNVKILEDEAILVDNKFYVVGRLDYEKTGKIGLERKTVHDLTENLDKTKPIIEIDHEPNEFDEKNDAGVDLDLGGHTHNGQLFPGNITIKLAWKNPWGIIKVGNMTNVTTSGAGVWGPNMRVGTNCEVAIINVKKGR